MGLGEKFRRRVLLRGTVITALPPQGKENMVEVNFEETCALR